jgi:hypothetical protein
MPSKKLSCKKIKEFIKDEKKGISDYRKTGLKNLAKDESKHKRYLIKLKRKMCR